MLNADEQIYMRYGGRDSQSPDTYHNLSSLELAAKQGLELHRQYQEGSLKKIERPKPLFPREIPLLVERTFARNQCVECHLIGDFQNLHREQDGTLDKLMHLYRSPDIKTIGIYLDVPKGLVVKEARDAVAAAGMKPGDRIEMRSPLGMFVLRQPPRVLAQPGGLQAGPAGLGVRVRVPRQHFVADEVLDERQGPAAGGVVGVRHSPNPEWPGHGPREIEDQVSYPLALELKGVAGVRVVRSSSDVGFSSISVIFEDDTSIDVARKRVGIALRGDFHIHALLAHQRVVKFNVAGEAETVGWKHGDALAFLRGEHRLRRFVERSPERVELRTRG
jgi:hypothetical protein